MSGVQASAGERADEIASNLARVERRIADACARAGRDRDEVTLVVVTKYFPVSDVRVLADLGVHEVGENRYQEAVAKSEECAELDLRWHFMGRLQSNKAAAVGRWADVVQSLDRAKLVTPLARGAQEREGRGPLDVLVQVNLDTDPEEAQGRGGADPADVPALAEAVAEAASLRLRGVMAVAPREGEPSAAFERLRAVSEAVRAVVPEATYLSAGMSGDLEAALERGATHVRVGGAILGNRPTNG
jgi:PLP dependent protein